MTKRAGKRKARNGVSAQKARPGRQADYADGLDESEALKLEINSLRQGWLVQGKDEQTKRQGLIKKLLDQASDTEDTDEALRIFKAIAQVETQTLSLAVRAQQGKGGDLPPQIAVGVQVNTAEEKEPEAPVVIPADPNAVADALLARPEVMAALNTPPAQRKAGSNGNGHAH